MKTSLVRGDFGGILKISKFTSVVIAQIKCKLNNVESVLKLQFPSEQKNPKQKILRGQQREFEKQQGEISPKYRSQKGKGRLAE